MIHFRLSAGTVKSQNYYRRISCNKTNLDALISQIYFWIETLHGSDSPSVHHQEFFTVHTANICHTGLLAACEQEHLLLLASCQHTCVTYTIAEGTVKNS